MTFVLPSEAIKKWDEYTILHESISSHELMERASMACVEWLSKKFNLNTSFAIVCGKGNNGGDGLAIARLLLEKGFNVKVYLDVNTNRSTDNLHNLNLLQTLLPHCIFSFKEVVEIQKDYVLLDALLGTGISKPLSDELYELVKQINNLNCLTISIDIPSGLHPDITKGFEHSIKADYTLSFECYKRCFILPESGNYCGEIIILPIGLIPKNKSEGEFCYTIIDKEIASCYYRKRNLFSHKGTYGHAILIAGSNGKMGASVLASHACLCSGCGLLSTFIPKLENSILQISLPEAMTIPYESITDLPALEKFNSIGIGCGIGLHDDVEILLNKLFNTSKIPLIIDADALNCIANSKNLIHNIPKGSLLTPHPREFDRLFGECHSSLVRLETQIEQAQKLDMYILLKGKFTSIVTPSGEVWINTTGNPGMAKGGSGDALTGIITGLYAQYQDMKVASLLGVYLHGLAGDLAASSKGMESMLTSDLISNLGKAYNTLNVLA